MDYIIRKLNSFIETSEPSSVDMQTLLRERLEYMLFLALGVLWNRNVLEVTVPLRKEIVENLHKISIGQVVGAIRSLDIHNEILSKRELKALNKYPELRNQLLGHGYTHGDKEEELEGMFTEIYEELIQFDFYKKYYDVVEVKTMSEGKYSGLRYAVQDAGIPCKWKCPAEVLEATIKIGDVLIVDSLLRYDKLTPFVHISDRGDSVFIFQSLEDKLSGKVKMNRLFRSEIKTVIVDDLIMMSYESDRRRISSNGTIMNYYDRNYSNYISMAIENTIKDFLLKNRSNVLATIWGHGGVGKTACVQSVCMELFNDLQNRFSYIIFVSAKDRKYDTSTGKITPIEGTRTFEQIIDSMIAVIFDEESEENCEVKMNRIFEITDKVLLVIDDYETFEDEEKGKILTFINRLNIDHFKVLITTRNKRFSSGIEIKMDEFDVNETKRFILNIFEKEYSDFLPKITKELESSEMLDKIYQATSGRALFLYQFAKLYAQKGLEINELMELKQSKEARDFLYGRLYFCLGRVAQREFTVISQIVDESELILKEEVLFFILNDINEDELEDGIQELMEQKIIEKYDDENYRVYSKDMILRMKEIYTQSDESIKDQVRNRLHMLGGRVKIKGTVYEALLEEANASRDKGNVKDTLQKYKQILNDEKCDQSIQKRALLNMTSYININLLDNERTIQEFDTYVEKLKLQRDVEVILMYVQYLWRADDIAKAKACDILERFFKGVKKNRITNKYFELFAIATTYLSHNVMENTPKKVRTSAENRVLNEYGNVLYNLVSKTDFREYKPSIKHHVSLGLVATVNLAIDLSNKGYDKSKLISEIKEFGFQNFDQLFRSQLNKLDTGERSELVNQIVEAHVTYVAMYGLLVDIKGLGKGIIHNTELNRKKMEGIKQGSIIKARIIGANNKGFILSTKRLNVEQ